MPKEMTNTLFGTEMYKIRARHVISFLSGAQKCTKIVSWELLWISSANSTEIHQVCVLSAPWATFGALPACAKMHQKLFLGASWQTLSALGTKIHKNCICGASGDNFSTPCTEMYHKCYLGASWDRFWGPLGEANAASAGGCKRSFLGACRPPHF